MIKRNIPNFVTLLNLACGFIGIASLYYGHYKPINGLANNNLAVYLMFAAAFFDFCDGFVARLLKVDSPLGKQLDSLADVVTFGVLPGLLSFILINNSLGCWHLQAIDMHPRDTGIEFSWTGFAFALPALLVAMLSAFRLAKFNIDTRQSHSFIGLPTPANGLFLASCYYVMSNYMPDTCLHPAIIAGIVLLFAILLVSPLPLFAMKFKSKGWKGNEVRFTFLGLAVATIITAAILGKVMAAVPILVILYILISIINNVATRNHNEV